MQPFKCSKITCLKHEKKKNRFNEDDKVNGSVDIIEDCYQEKH